jgi:hypothetical protein
MGVEAVTLKVLTIITGPWQVWDKTLPPHLRKRLNFLLFLEAGFLPMTGTACT